MQVISLTLSPLDQNPDMLVRLYHLANFKWFHKSSSKSSQHQWQDITVLKLLLQFLNLPWRHCSQEGNSRLRLINVYMCMREWVHLALEILGKDTLIPPGVCGAQWDTAVALKWRFPQGTTAPANLPTAAKELLAYGCLCVVYCVYSLWPRSSSGVHRCQSIRHRHTHTNRVIQSKWCWSHWSNTNLRAAIRHSLYTDKQQAAMKVDHEPA